MYERSFNILIAKFWNLCVTLDLINFRLNIRYKVNGTASLFLIYRVHSFLSTINHQPSTKANWSTRKSEKNKPADARNQHWLAYYFIFALFLFLCLAFCFGKASPVLHHCSSSLYLKFRYRFLEIRFLYLYILLQDGGCGWKKSCYRCCIWFPFWRWRRKFFSRIFIVDKAYISSFSLICLFISSLNSRSCSSEKLLRQSIFTFAKKNINCGRRTLSFSICLQNKVAISREVVS